MINAQESKVQKLYQTYLKVQTSSPSFASSYSSNNTVAFISFKSNYEADLVLEAFRMNHYGGVCPKIFSCFKPKPKYTIIRAPEPDNVIWENFGYTKGDRFKRMLWTRPILIVCVPVVVFSYFLLKASFAVISHDLDKSSYLELIVYKIVNYGVIAGFTYMTKKLIDWLERAEKKLTSTKYLSRKAFIAGLLKAFYVVCESLAEINKQIGNISKYDQRLVNSAIGSIIAGSALEYLVSSSILTPLMLVADFSALKQWWKRRSIKKAFSPQGLSESSSYHFMTQGMLDECFDRQKPEIDTKYSQVYTLMLLFSFGSFYTPLLTGPFVFITILLIGLVELRLFYRRYARPLYDTSHLSDVLFERLILIPKLLTFGLFAFYSVLDDNVKLADKEDVGGVTPGLSKIMPFLITICFNFEWLLRKVKSFTVSRYLWSTRFVRRSYDEACLNFKDDYELRNPASKYSQRVKGISKK